MKKALVTYPYNQGDHEVVLIENLNDLQDYTSYLQKSTLSKSQSLLKSKVPISRWDHCVGGGTAGDGVWAHSISKSSIKGTNPLWEVDNIVFTKVGNMLEYILRGDTLIVNSKGGYSPLKEGFEIIERSIWEEDKTKWVSLKEGTKYMNLENDSELESHTKKRLSTIDPNYSYVVNLREFNGDELAGIFSDFQERGGETVYVYTTGSDIQQMWDYCGVIIESGINHIEFEFNAGSSVEIERVVNYLESNHVKVDIINS